jgi:type II secretory pathway pseudopilin PulG
VRRREEGFTLIELAVALGLFGLVIVSLSLLFDRALETSTRVRADQVAKVLAQRKMEEVRGLPVYVSQRTDTGNVDVLDLYFPDDAGVSPTATGAVGTYDATVGVWSFTSEETITTEPGSPYTRRVVVQFVRPLDDGSIQVRQPITGYGSDLLDFDRPAASAVSVAVTVTHTVEGQSRSVTLNTVMAQTRHDQPKVEAGGSVLAAQVSGLAVQDGDSPGQAADILAQVGFGQVTYREVSAPSAQASADPLQVTERDPTTNVPLQAPGPSGGSSSATAPNSSTGNVDDPTPSGLPDSPSVSTINDPVVVIGSWEGTNPSADTAARVSSIHSQNPEAVAAVALQRFLLSSRDPGDAVPEAAVELGESSGLVEEASTTSQSSVTAELDIVPDSGDPAVTIWGAPQFLSNEDFEGVLTIESIHVEVEATAAASSVDTHVHWRVEDLRIWDPDADGGEGDYVGPWTFGFDHDCGGWEDDPITGAIEGPPVFCGATRFDQTKAPFENPNPIVIPAAYAGTDDAGAPQTAITIVVGATVMESASDPAAGTSNATAAQKNILSITTRDDLTGAVPVEPMLLELGDANTSVSYVAHEH